MKNRLFFLLISLTLILTPFSIVYSGIKVPTNAARFGYFWQNNSLPYDTEFSYFFDVAVYPEGIFADCDVHDFVYITAQNKHIGYGGITYGVEVVLQYGHGFNNVDSVKRVWLADYDDPTRYTTAWIDDDADGIDYWDLSTLLANGYLISEPDPQGDVLKFLRVQEQTIFMSETTNPVQSTWENRFYFYNFSTNQWDMKASDSFTIPASRQAVRDSTYQAGSGIWAGILETDGDNNIPPDFGAPPVNKVVYKNRWVRVVDQGVTTMPALNNSNQWWIEPNTPYQLFFRDQPEYTAYGAGNETIETCTSPIEYSVFLPLTIQPSASQAFSFADDFSFDTTASYAKTGTVNWQASEGNVLLGNGLAENNKLHKSLSFSTNSVLSGRVLIPATGVGFYDSVALSLSGGGVEYWATLGYGSNLVEHDHISIMRNDVWGPLYPMTLNPGWYTVKVFVDFENNLLWMKTWPDTSPEPDWQISRVLETASINQFGFRHYGVGTVVDDLAVAPSP